MKLFAALNQSYAAIEDQIAELSHVVDINALRSSESPIDWATYVDCVKMLHFLTIALDAYDRVANHWPSDCRRHAAETRESKLVDDWDDNT